MKNTTAVISSAIAGVLALGSVASLRGDRRPKGTCAKIVGGYITTVLAPDEQ
jgi:hypothetical protein